MKTKDTWQFSAPLAEVNVRRILREAAVKDGNVVRFTIDGKVYTAWLESAFPDFVTPGFAKGYWLGDENVVYRDDARDGGPVFIRLARSGDLPEYYYHRIRICRGDHVKALFDRVEVQVETFAAPK